MYITKNRIKFQVGSLHAKNRPHLAPYPPHKWGVNSHTIVLLIKCSPNGMSHPGSTNNQGEDTFHVHALIGGQDEAVGPQDDVL